MSKENDRKSSGFSRRDFLRSSVLTGAGVAAGAGSLATGTVLGPTRSAWAQSKGTLRIGAPLGMTGIFSGDMEEFRRGLIMAIEDINATGGLAGYKLEAVVDDAEDTFDQQVRASFERLLHKEKVDVVVAGYFIASGVELDMVAEAGVVYVSQQAQIAVKDAIAANRQKYRMIFQTCPSGDFYGWGFADFMDTVPEDWLAYGKTVAIIGGDNGYSEQIHKATRPAMEQAGWEETYFEVVPYGIPDWTPTLTKIRNNPPSVIAMNDGIVGDDALFIRHFSDLPTNSLIYQVFTPSTPEYLEVTGDLANGVVWSTVIGLLPDKIGKDFRARYRKRWNGDEPSFGAAGPMYDQVMMWAEAARTAGDPKDSEAVAKALTNVNYRGAAGSYAVRENNLTVPSYPTEESDPSLGLPHTFYQIVNGEHICVWPDPYAEAKLTKAPWMS